MAFEIERKFLVLGDFMQFVFRSITIKQGYLMSTEDKTVRIRIQDQEAYLTIKGRSSEDGLKRYEFETHISHNEALDLLKLCDAPLIEKTRHIIPTSANLKWEVDVFEGDNKGLILAEIELESEDQNFEKPHWLGVEVTGQLQYYNSYLAKNSFKNWNSID